MKANKLSELERRAIIDVARRLSVRASVEGPPQPSGADGVALDTIASLRDKVDSIARTTNVRISTLTVSINCLNDKVAAISGEFDAVRQCLAEMQSKFDDERRDASEATAIFIERLTREVATGMDGLADVAVATAEAQFQLTTIARQIADSVGARVDSTPIDSSVL